MEIFIYFLLPASFYLTVRSLYSYKLYNKIKKEGVRGFARLVSCKRVYYGKYSLLAPHYDPIVEFTYADKIYNMKAMGRFMFYPIFSKEVEIAFLEKYPDKVVIIRKETIKNHFITEILFCFTLFGLTVYYLFFLY